MEPFYVITASRFPVTMGCNESWTMANEVTDGTQNDATSTIWRISPRPVSSLFTIAEEDFRVKTVSWSGLLISLTDTAEWVASLSSPY